MRILVQMEGLIKGMREAESITRQSAAGMQSALDSSTASMQQLEQAAQQTRSAAGWLGGALSGLSAIGMVTMKGIAQTSMRTQELGIVLDVVSRNAGVAAETTAQMEAEMKELGMTTQAARTIITRMIQTNVDLAKGTDLVRVAQNLAVISEEDSSQAAQGLMRAIVSMNPILLRKYGIMTGLEDIDRRAGEALGILSYETDKSGKTIKKWTREITGAERQQAIFNMILEEGAKFSGTYEAAMEAAGKGMRSFPRYIMEAQEAIGEYWLPILDKAVDTFAALLKAFNNASPVLKKFVAIALPVGTALAGLAGAALMLYSQWGRIGPVIKGVTTLLSGLAAPVAAVIAVVAALGAAWHFNWFGIQDITASVVSRLQEMFGALIATLQEVIGAFISGAPGDYPWEDIFPPWLADIAYKVAHIFEGVRDVILDMRAGVFGVDYPWEDVFPPWLADIAYKAVSAFKKAQEAIQILQQVIDAFVSGAPGDYPWEDIFPPWLADIAYEVSHIFEGIRAVIEDMRAGVFGVDYPWEDVFPPWLADIAYKVMAALQSVVEVIAINAENIRQGIAQLGAAFTEAGLPGLIAEAGQQMYFAIEQHFGTNVADAVALAVETIDLKLTEFGTKITDQLRVIGENLAIAGAELAPFLTEALGHLGTAIDEAAQGWIEGAESGIGGLRGAFEAGLPEVVAAVSALGQGIQAAWDVIWETLPEPVRIAVESVRATLESLSAFITEKVIPTLEVIGNVLGALAETILPPLQAAFQSIKDTLSTELGPTLEELRELWEALGPVIETLAKILSGAIVVVIGVLGALVAGLAEGFAAAFDNILRIVQGVVEVITGYLEAFAGTIEWLTGLVTGNLEQQQAGWQKMKDGCEKIIEGFRTTVENAFQGMVDFVSGVVSGFVEGIVGFFQNLYDRLVGGSIIPNLLESIKSIFSTKLAEVVTTVITAVTNMIAAFRNRVSDFTAAGRAIIAGAVSGIRAKAQSLIDAVKSAVQGALDWIHEKLGMSSPSRLFFEMGVDMMHGLSMGIHATARLPLAELGDTIVEIARIFDQAQEAWDKFLTKDNIQEIKDFGEALTSVIGALNDVLAMSVAFGGWEPLANFREGIDRLIDDTEYILRAVRTKLLDLWSWRGERTDTVWGHMASWASAVRGIVDILGDAVKTFTEIAKYKGLMPGALDILVADIEAVLYKLGKAAPKFEEEGLYAASQFAEIAGQIVEAIGHAIDTLVTLRDYAGPTRGAIDNFFADLEYFLDTFAQGMWRFESLASAEAAETADLMERILNSLGKAIQPLIDLAEYAPDQADFRRGVDSFFANLGYFLDEFARGVSRFENLASERAAETAKLLGEIVGDLGKAVQPLLDLADYAVTPAEFQRAADLFFDHLLLFIQMFAARADEFDAHMSAEIVELAEAIGKAVSGIGAAIQPLIDLAEYGYATDDKGRKVWWDPEALVQSYEHFFYHLGMILYLLEEAAAYWQVSDAAKRLAEAVAQVTSDLGTAVGFLADVADYGVDKSAFALLGFQHFLDDLKAIIFMIEEASVEMSGAVEAARAFADICVEVLSNLQRGIDKLNELTGLGVPPEDLVEAGKLLVQSLADGFIEAQASEWGRMLTAFSDRFHTFVNVFLPTCMRVMHDRGWHIGAHLIWGMMEGLNAQASALYDTVWRIVQNAIAAAETAAGIASFSKLTFNLGAELTEGFIRGMQANQQGVIDSLTGMLAMPMTFAPQLAGAGGGETHTHYHYQEAEGIGADARASLRQDFEALELYQRLRS